MHRDISPLSEDDMINGRANIFYPESHWTASDGVRYELHICLTSFRQLFSQQKKTGIDPEKSKVFVQSHVPAHTELAWLLNCATPMNWLERMIQFKDKAKKQGTDSVGVGLFTYPILMAADILLYQADRVPVGEDQRQHLELARDIVRRFNGEYCKGGPFKKRCKAAGIPSRPTFTEPEAMIVKQGARIMSLADGTSKMSKSDPNDASRINVLDPPDVIRAKIKKCKTDAENGIEWDNPDRPEATNLLSIYSAVQPGRSKESIMEEVKDCLGESSSRSWPMPLWLTWSRFKQSTQRFGKTRNTSWEFLVMVLTQPMVLPATPSKPLELPWASFPRQNKRCK